MKNAMKEFIDHIEQRDVLYAIITYGGEYHEKCSRKFHLPFNYTQHDYSAFLQSINFEYDSGYGLQNLFGTIWYKDGTWSSRGEYDGSEWWDYYCVPKIPKECSAQYTNSPSPNSEMVECQSKQCHMCCPVGDEYCPKTPCLIYRRKQEKS